MAQRTRGEGRAIVNSWCPCCGEMEKFHYDRGYRDSDGMQIEPDEWRCERCRFTYSQHVNRPMSEAALKHAPTAVEVVAKAAERGTRRKDLEIVCGQTTTDMGQVDLLHRIEKDIRALIKQGEE